MTVPAAAAVDQMDEADQAGQASLAQASGLALQCYRPAHVSACVARALARHDMQNMAGLARLCRRDPAVRATLRRSILVPVTGLFRDPEQFELLERMLPALIGVRAGLRVWSAGSSDGSELYSVALILRRLGVLARCRLLGSDMSDEGIELAREGAVVTGVVRSELQAVLRWERRDLLREPPPPGLFGLVLCRNVTIYFEPAAQRAVHAKLAASLRQDGLLMLGRSEWLLHPATLGLRPAGPHVYRKEAS